MRVEAIRRGDDHGLLCTVRLDQGELPTERDVLTCVRDGTRWRILGLDGPVALSQEGAAIGALMGVVLDPDASVVEGDELRVAAAGLRDR